MIDESAVTRFASQVVGRPGYQRKPSRIAQLEAEVAALRGSVAARQSPETVTKASAEIERERDDLRAKVTGLEETIARLRSAAEMQNDADGHRAAVIEHLLAALDAAERADHSRREAISEYEEAIASRGRPGHLGQMT